MQKCLECNQKLAGRLDQKFCDTHCKSAYHYKLNREKQPSIYVSIDAILKNNRRILKKI